MLLAAAASPPWPDADARLPPLRTGAAKPATKLVPGLTIVESSPDLPKPLRLSGLRPLVLRPPILRASVRAAPPDESAPPTLGRTRLTEAMCASARARRASSCDSRAARACSCRATSISPRLKGPDSCQAPDWSSPELPDLSSLDIPDWPRAPDWSSLELPAWPGLDPPSSNATRPSGEEPRQLPVASHAAANCEPATDAREPTRACCALLSARSASTRSVSANSARLLPSAPTLSIPLGTRYATLPTAPSALSRPTPSAAAKRGGVR
mmetsp:Transcript_31707/g.73902  ORF Transcript_31707/g.73902 Transcript_31707/m.73902 type:complete len:268 (+) Transcript_31707:841-1644(+)